MGSSRRVTSRRTSIDRDSSLVLSLPSSVVVALVAFMSVTEVSLVLMKVWAAEMEEEEEKIGCQISWGNLR